MDKIIAIEVEKEDLAGAGDDRMLLNLKSKSYVNLSNFL